MGIKRGAYESQTLGEVAASAKPASVQLNSAQAGFEAMAQGTKAYAAAVGGVADCLKNFGELMGQLAGYTGKSRDAVRKNDEQEQVAASNYKTVVQNEGEDSQNAHDALRNLENIQSRRSILGIMSFGADPHPEYNKKGE